MKYLTHEGPAAVSQTRVSAAPDVAGAEHALRYPVQGNENGSSLALFCGYQWHVHLLQTVRCGQKSRSKHAFNSKCCTLSTLIHPNYPCELFETSRIFKFDV